MLAALGIIVGEEAELGTPLYNDKVVGPAIYQVSYLPTITINFVIFWSFLILINHTFCCLSQFQEADQLTGFAFGAAILALIALLEFTTINIGWESVEQKTARDPENKTGSQLAPGYTPGALGTYVAGAFTFSFLFTCSFCIIVFIFSSSFSPHFFLSCLIGFDPLGLSKNMDADAFATIQAKELNNGRLAMIATAGKNTSQSIDSFIHSYIIHSM